MIRDLQNWCKEASEQGRSSRNWEHLKQVYIVGNMSETNLRDGLQTLASNNSLRISFDEPHGGVATVSLSRL
jgi:hypothetical protein